METLRKIVHFLVYNVWTKLVLLKYGPGEKQGTCEQCGESTVLHQTFNSNQWGFLEGKPWYWSVAQYNDWVWSLHYDDPDFNPEEDTLPVTDENACFCNFHELAQ